MSVGAGVVRVFGGDASAAAGGYVSPLDRGFTLGDAVYETVRVYSGAPFLLGAHLARLRGGGARLGLEVPEGVSEIVHGVLREGEERGLHRSDAALRITLSRGVAQYAGLAPDAGAVPTLVVALRPLPGSGVTDTALRLLVARSRRNELSATAGCKVTTAADSVVELLHARERGCDDVVFLDTAGHLSEGSASNVFVYDGESLATPPPGCGALPGITRAVVMEVAAALGVPCEERVLEREEAYLAKELFLTSSIRELASVGEIDGWRLRQGEEGVFEEIRRGFRHKVLEATGGRKPG